MLASFPGLETVQSLRCLQNGACVHIDLHSNLNVTVRSLTTSMFEPEVKLAFTIIIKTILTSNNCGIHVSTTITSVH